MSNGSQGNLRIAYGVSKAAAMAVGFVATLVSLQASVGAFAQSGWIRVPVALAVAVGLPLIIADRFLPDDPREGRGIATDVFAISWLVFAFVFTGALQPTTKPLLTREGDRLTASGWVQLGRATYFLAGVTPTGTGGEAQPSGGGSSGVPGEPPGDGGTESASDGAVVPASTADAAAKPPAGSDKTPAQLFKELAPSVVTIFVEGAFGEGGGTGFVVDATGMIVTNHHVISRAKAVRIKFLSGTIYDDIELLSEDESLDLALLHIDPNTPADGGTKVDVAPLTLGDSDAVVVGERAISIGNPLGLEHTLTDGLVSARRVYMNKHWIQMSVPVSPGNSGGPLFNMRGEVIGITAAKLHGENLNLAIPVNDLKKLFKPAYPGRHRIGAKSEASQW